MAVRGVRGGPVSESPGAPAPTGQDEYAMRIALDQAHNAWLVGEVPVGAP